MDKVNKPDDWVSIVEERVKDSEDWNMKRQILRQVNYYLGNQWIVWNPTSKTMVEAPKTDNEERITHNVIKPRVMTKLAKQTKNRIKYDVMPDTNDDNRIEIAKAAHKFIQHWWQEEEMDRKTRDIFLNNSVKGWCAAKVYFDPEAGQDITPSPEEEGYEEGNSLFTGEIKCRIVDPLTLYIDPAATSDEEIRWVIEEKPRDVDYIKERYGKDVTPDENINFLGNYEIGTASGSFGTNMKQKKNKNMAMVREMWVSPCIKYPHGLKVTVADKTLLDIDEKAGDHPYIIFGDIPIPGSIKYDAFIKDMLPIQREINIMRTMLTTHAKRLGNSLWLIPYGSGIDEDDLSNEIGGFVHYNPASGAKPERAEPPNLPNIYDRILEYSMRDIDDLSGAREIAQGRLPAGLDTASGLAMMVEQENEKLAVSSQNYERGMKKLLKRVLMLMKKHYTEERMGRILGENNEIEVVSFTGADLSGGEDINIVQGSSLPEMKSAQQDRIMMLWDKGAIVKKDGTPDHETLLRLMGMGDSTELFEMNQLDENKAKMENKTFQSISEDQNALQMVQQWQMQSQQFDAETQQAAMQGIDIAQYGIQPPPKPPGLPIVRDFFDHEIHIYHHNVFRKSNEYEELPQEIQQLVDDHVQEHIDALNAPMIEQQQQQMMMQQQQQAQQVMNEDKQHQQNLENMQMKHEMDMQKEMMKQG